MKKPGLFFGSLFYILVFTLMFSYFAAFTYLPTHGEEEIYNRVIRLHILANSDSESDQAQKLRLRDLLLDEVRGKIGEYSDVSEAKAALSELLPELETFCEEKIRESGSDYPVKLTLTREDYPTRNYESFCFPGGNYLSLRVIIGEGEGQNWWCVLFPPLCLSAALGDKSEAEEQFISVGLTDEQYRIITETDEPKYKIRFKILEAAEEFFAEVRDGE